jgi:ABC-type branched-subunit amino acid transport system ATPase component
MSLLKTDQLEKRFGGLHVTRSVSFSIDAGERVALIGPNGAGKTTLVNLLGGVLRPDAGRIHLDGSDITGFSQTERVKAGLVRTFQLTMLAPALPVQRQVELALFERQGLTRRFWRSIDDYPELAREALELLRFVGLAEQAGAITGLLAYGEQRLVEIALALALRPNVLLLDEPMAGVPRAESTRLFNVIDSLPADTAVLIIEHDMDVVFRIADRIIVMADGAILAQGSPDEIRHHSDVRTAYLGH